MSYQGGAPLLEFSADDTRTYVVEASSNLVDWVSLGPAPESPAQSGDYSFTDTQSGGAPARYYRIQTQ